MISLIGLGGGLGSAGTDPSPFSSGQASGLGGLGFNGNRGSSGNGMSGVGGKVSTSDIEELARISAETDMKKSGSAVDIFYSLQVSGLWCLLRSCTYACMNTSYM